MLIKSVSFSSDKKLARCEQQFSYRYEEGLKRKLKKIGLFRGDWMHQLMAAYYIQKRDGLKQGWKTKFKQLKAEKWDKLFDEEKEEYGENFLTYTKELMSHYVEYWAPRMENWKILEVEKRYELSTKFGFPIVWIIDLLVECDGMVILVEHKNKKSIPDVSERILQPQVHGYAWLLSKVGIKVDKILWDYVRTEPVPRPRINKDGSLSKRQIETDQRGYLLSLKEAGLMPENESEWQSLNDHLKNLPETLSLERFSNSVNLRMGEQFIKQWVIRAQRGRKIKTPLRNWGKDCRWGCDYYNLCQADMRGDVDRTLLIAKDFTTKPDHRDQEVK